MLIDTDVLIWYMRGHAAARQCIGQHIGFMVSAVTYMELVQGMRDKRELAALKGALRHWQAQVIPIDEAVSARALSYVERFFLSHAVMLADALIGATAAVHGLTLLTGNERHYRALGEVAVEVFRPE